MKNWKTSQGKKARILINKRFVFLHFPKTGDLLPWLIPSALFVGLLAVRIPFLCNPLMGEEGCFAYLAVDTGRGPIDYYANILNARVQGRDIFAGGDHPVAAYLLLKKVIRNLFPVNDFSALPFRDKTLLGRIPFLAIFALALLVLLVIAKRALQLTFHQSVLAVSLLAFAGTTSLLVAGSIQPQLDGGLGVLIVALASACMVVAGRYSRSRGQVGFAFLAGFLGCLGKNEWALAFLGALICGLVIGFAFRNSSGAEDRPSVSMVGGIALGTGLGILAGALFSWWLDPDMYVAGFHLMRRSQSQSAGNWWTTFRCRLAWIWPFAMLLLVAAALLIRHGRQLLSREFPMLLVFLWGLGMTAGFVFSAHSGDGFPRYFCPPLFALLSFEVILLRSYSLPRGLSLCLAAMLMAGGIFNVRSLYQSHKKGVSITSEPGMSLRVISSSYQHSYQEFLLGRQPIQGQQSAFAYYFPEADYVPSWFLSDWRRSPNLRSRSGSYGR